jgi:hypothetical protein
MKLLVAAVPQQMADATASVANTNQHPTAPEPLQEEPQQRGAVAAEAATAAVLPTTAMTAAAEAT